MGFTDQNPSPQSKLRGGATASQADKGPLMPTQGLLRPMEGSFRQKEGLCQSERAFCPLKRALPAHTDTFQAATGTSWTEKDLLRSKEGLFKPIKGPLRPKKGLPVNTSPLRLRERPFRSKDRPPKLTSDPQPGQQLVISKVGVAPACIGFALFEFGAARATPKVYKYPLLIVSSGYSLLMSGWEHSLPPPHRIYLKLT